MVVERENYMKSLALSNFALPLKPPSVPTAFPLVGFRSLDVTGLRGCQTVADGRTAIGRRETNQRADRRTAKMAAGRRGHKRAHIEFTI